MWEKACDKNLARALKLNLISLDIDCDCQETFDVDIPRLFGTEHALCLPKLISLSEKKDWGSNQKFKIRFIEQLRWVQNLLNGDIGEVYRQSKIYRARGDDWPTIILANVLHQWAMEKNYPPAIFDIIQWDFAKKVTPNSEGLLKYLAAQGYMPAILDAARRFLNGDGVKKNLGDAYYWIKRAEVAQGNLSGIIEKPYERLLEQMTEHEKISLSLAIMDYGEPE